jgi:hypothetical protein
MPREGCFVGRQKDLSPSFVPHGRFFNSEVYVLSGSR